MTSIRLLAVVCAALTLQSQPTFRTGVDLIRLDVSVVDNAGRSVEDLKPEDFSVRIGGTPRTVSFLRFYGSGEHSTVVAPATSTVATNTGRPSGRVVVFVVDLESMTPGYERLVMETASNLVDRLSPVDSSGLVLIPGKGIELTHEHARVKAAIAAVRGWAPGSSFQTHALSVQEADAFEKQNTRVIAEVVERECRPSEGSACVMELRREAKQLLVDATRRVQNVLTTLTTVSTRLKTIDAPTSMVFISAGLPAFQEVMGRFRDLRDSAAESGVMTYVVQLEQPEGDASSRSRPGAASLSRSDLSAGLSAIAGATGGSMYHGVGKAAGAFERIRGEITSSYQLGVETSPQDAGKTREVEVKVTRPGLTVRSRKEIMVSATPPAPLKLGDVLSYPTDLADAAIAVAAYSTRGEEAATLKVILALELLGKGETPLPGAAEPSYAIKITKDGETRFETGETLAPSDKRVVIAAQLPPGQYRLRAAVLDVQGRPGSLDMPLSVGLRQAGELQFSDLIVGVATERFVPIMHSPADSPLATLLDVYSADPLQLADVSVDLELRKVGSETVVARRTVSLTKTGAERRRVAEGVLTPKDASPGTYVVSAILNKSGAPVGKVTRPVVLTAP